jgi:hypothetical protein
MRIPLLAVLALLALTLVSGNAQTPPDSQRRVIRVSPSSSAGQDEKAPSLEANYQLRLKGTADKNVFLDLSVIGSGRVFSIQTAEEQPAHFQGRITPEGDHFVVDYGITQSFKVATDPGAHVPPGSEFRDAAISGTVKLTPGKTMRIAEVNGKTYTLEIRPTDSPEK